MIEPGTLSLKNIYTIEMPYFTKSSIDEDQKQSNIFSSLHNWIYPDIYGTAVIEYGDNSHETCENTINTYSSESSNAEISNKNRVQLLARKYIYEKLSPEDEARLEIERQRVKQLIPLVTKEDYKAIGDMLDDLSKSIKQHKRIKKLLGIE